MHRPGIFLFSRASVKIPPMRIGSWTLPNRVFVAPMAGVTDRPYRRLCKKLGAGYAVSEMAASNPQLWDSVKTSRRLDHDGEIDPVAVQLAGSDPDMMAEAAVFNIRKGARIIDINMGCPVKKVCNVASGSALCATKPGGSHSDRVVRHASPLMSPSPSNPHRLGPQDKNAVRIARLAQRPALPP